MSVQKLDVMTLSFKTQFVVLKEIFQKYVLSSSKMRLVLFPYCILVLLSKYASFLAVQVSNSYVSNLNPPTVFHGPSILLVSFIALKLFNIVITELISFVFTPLIQQAYCSAVQNTFDSFFEADYRSLKKHGSGSIQACVERRGSAVSDILEAVLIDVLPIFVAIGVTAVSLCFQMGPIVSFLLVLTVILLLTLTVRITCYRTLLRRELNRRLNKQSNCLYDTLSNIDTVLAYNNQHLERKRFSTHLKKAAVLYSELYRSYYVLNFLQKLVLCLLLVSILSVPFFKIDIFNFDKKTLNAYLRIHDDLSTVLHKSGYLYSKYAIGIINYASSQPPVKNKQNTRKPNKLGSIGIENKTENHAIDSADEKETSRIDSSIQPLPSVDGHFYNCMDETIPANDNSMDSRYIRNESIESVDNGKIAQNINNYTETSILNSETSFNSKNIKFKHDPVTQASYNPCKAIEKTLNASFDGSLDTSSGIVFQNTTIRHGSRVLHSKLNFKIYPGQRVAVVGRNGIGKSTLIRSLIGFTEYDGLILINNKNIKEQKIEEIRKLMAYIAQDSGILNDTITYNIQYGNDHLSEQQIIDLCKKLNIHESIERLPNGYKTICGERGTALSGGEKQKIAFARALAKQATIYILDEPTAAMDKHAEADILRMVFEFTIGKILLCIVHNTALLSMFDIIVYLHSDEIREIGKYDELLAQKGMFHDYLLSHNNKINK